MIIGRYLYLLYKPENSSDIALPVVSTIVVVVLARVRTEVKCTVGLLHVGISGLCHCMASARV